MDTTPTLLRTGGLRAKLVADAELICRAALVAGLAGLVLPDDVFSLPADVAALHVAGGVAGRAALHMLGRLLAGD